MDTERIAAYLRHEIGEWTKAGGTVIALAKAVGVSGPYISQLRAGQRGVGLGAMQGFADHWGITLAQLEQRATEWAARNPQPPPPASPDRYPARVKAIARAKEDGRSDRAIHAVATFQGHDADALTVEAWSNLIASFEAAFAAGKLGAKKTK